MEFNRENLIEFSRLVAWALLGAIALYAGGAIMILGVYVLFWFVGLLAGY